MKIKKRTISKEKAAVNTTLTIPIRQKIESVSKKLIKKSFINHVNYSK